jgi:hypothetical protein
MKFYKDNIRNYFWNRISVNKLTTIYYDNIAIRFFKNGKYHNNKNVCYVHKEGYKYFYLDGKYYGDQDKFTKKSWRRFIKLKAFL